MPLNDQDVRVAGKVRHGDCLGLMRAMPPASVDLVFCSPPYEAARTYGIDFNLKGQAWVDWSVERFVECLRVSRGLVAWVVEGTTRDFQYSAAPALLMADLHRRGVKLRKPPIYRRIGIPGSGGPDWLRNDWEWIVCAANGKLPWADNVAMGHIPKWGPGGEMSNRLGDGARVNQWGKNGGPRGMGNKNADGTVDCRTRPSHNVVGGPGWGMEVDGDLEPPPESAFGNKPSTACGREGYKKTYFNGKGHPGNRKAISRGHDSEGRPVTAMSSPMPAIANPGNVIDCKVGGGLMGHDLAHENEAPFPLALAEFFVRSFCPPDGTVLDPFCGSGTTLHAAAKWGRHGMGLDIRESQCDLTRRRLADASPALFSGATP